MAFYRAEIEYKVRRVVYLTADTKDEAKTLVQGAEWEDALSPHECIGPHDRITVKSLAVER